MSGRLLVGLRWWNEVTDEGSNWRFESLAEVHNDVLAVATLAGLLRCNQTRCGWLASLKHRLVVSQGQREINKQDKFIFWWSLYLAVRLETPNG